MSAQVIRGFSRSRRLAGVAVLIASGIALVLWFQSTLLGQRVASLMQSTRAPGDKAVVPTRIEDRTISPQVFARAASHDLAAEIAPKTPKLYAVNIGLSVTEGTADIGLSRSTSHTYVARAIMADGSVIAEIHGGYVVMAKDGVSSVVRMEAGQP